MMVLAASGSMRCHASVRSVTAGPVPKSSNQGRKQQTHQRHQRHQRQEAQVQRFCSRRLPVKCSASAKDEELSPGGSKMVDGNRPTSPKAWEAMYKLLTENNVRSVVSSDIEGLKGRGAIIIDVRPGTEFEAGHIEGSVNVSLYQPITGNTPRQVLRKAGYAFFGIFNGTEANENFESELKEAVGDVDNEVVVICNTGGSLENTVNFNYGKQSRSLMAAYEMITFGYKKLRFLEGGYNQWRSEEREVVVVE